MCSLLPKEILIHKYQPSCQIKYFPLYKNTRATLITGGLSKNRVARTLALNFPCASMAGKVLPINIPDWRRRNGRRLVGKGSNDGWWTIEEWKYIGAWRCNCRCGAATGNWVARVAENWLRCRVSGCSFTSVHPRLLSFFLQRNSGEKGAIASRLLSLSVGAHSLCKSLWHFH